MPQCSYLLKYVLAFLNELNQHHKKSFKDLSEVQDFIRQLITKNLEWESTKINSQLRHDQQYDEIKTLQNVIEYYKKYINLIQSQRNAKDEEIEQLKTKIDKLEKEAWTKIESKIDHSKNEEPSASNVRQKYMLNSDPLCIRHNQLYLYLSLKSQNPFRFNCQFVKAITYMFCN